MRKLTFLVVAITTLGLAASAMAYEAEAVSNGGTISGTVKYDGPAPAPKEIQVTKDKEVCGLMKHFDQTLVVGSDGGIANAVVVLTDISKGEAVKPTEAKFDQKGCQYDPHVLVVPVGSTVDVTNSDGILHNIHTYSTKNPPFNMAQPKFKKVIKVTSLTQPEVIRVTCDAHNWMGGWWVVVDNPYYAVTDDKGNFTIKDVPPGDYTVQVWQEKLGKEDQKISVKGGQTATANFSMKPKS
ncbi:MAG TPA: carboxypeptidase regulatory-like domain-containing protein [Candidatus Binataceae bacterium]|nr:carboxypeptidase regulatory-like domain-containing protein [Candidatus Binataceae bacterium]